MKPTEKERNWKLLEAIWYHGIFVSRDFITDGASIPLGLRWLFPHGGRKFFGAVVHDYCYRTGCVSRKRADTIFLEAMLENNVSSLEANTIYRAVRMFGALSYKKVRITDDDEKGEGDVY